MAVEWIEPKTRRALRGVSITKNGLRVGDEEAAALGNPAYVRVGIDSETQTLVIAPGEERHKATIRRYKGGRSHVIQALWVMQVIQERLGWAAGDKLQCVVRDRTLEVRRAKPETVSDRRRGDLSRALGV